MISLEQKIDVDFFFLLKAFEVYLKADNNISEWHLVSVTGENKRNEDAMNAHSFRPVFLFFKGRASHAHKLKRKH